MKLKITFAFLLFTLICSLGYAQQVPELMYFKFNQNVGGQTPNDAPSTTRLGTATATVTGLTVGGTGQFGTGLQGNAGVTASNNVNPGWTGTYTGDWTISLWLNVPIPASTRYFFGNSTGGGTFRCFTGGVANNGIRLTGGTPSLTLDVTSIQPGPVVITYVYNSTLGTIDAYKNGVFEVSGTVPSGFTITGSNFFIGSQGTSIEGIMDEFRFYNRALLPAEVSLVWDKELPYSSGPNDAGVYELTAPLNFCASSSPQDIKVKIKNYGNNLINNVQVGWSLDGVTQTPISINTPLDTMGGAGINELEVTLGSHVFTASAVDLIAWTYSPNGNLDTSNFNDTLSQTLHSSLSGTYTINSALPTSGMNYQNFTDFTSDLNTYGVCGPVTANVSGGPFIEKVAFGNIEGTSPINTIRINGNGATVQFTNTSTDRQLLTLSGTKYLTIDSLTFKTLATDYGWAALITNNAAYDSIINCYFDLTSVTSISSANNNGITFSGSNTSATTTGNNGSHIYIGNNHLKWSDSAGGAYYALSLAGTSDSNVVEKNIFENFYYYGTYINGATGAKILNNEYHKQNKTASLTTFYGIYSTGITPGLEISGNSVHTPGGSLGYTGTFYGIYSLGDGTLTDPVLISNNVVYDVNQNGTLYGIYLSTSPYNLVYHNTIIFDKPLASTSTSYGIYATGTNTNTDIKNNNVVITAGTSGIKYGFYYSTAASVNDAQKNNFYVNSTQNGVQNYGYYTSAYATQAVFQSAYPLLEVGSPTADPLFVNASIGNFNVQSPQLIGNGVNLQSIVPFDINGNPRPATPTIGAFEQPPSGSNNAGMMSFVTPTGSYCAGLQSVSAIINNGGVNNLTSLKVNWTVNGVAQPQFSYSGTLVPITSTGTNSATVVLGNATIPSGTPTVIKAWTSLPNGVADIYNSNDTIELNFQASHFFVEAVSDTICVGGDAMLSLNPSTGYNVGDLQWQTSTNGTSWTSIANSDDIEYSETNLLANKYFRVKIGAGSNICYSDSVQVVAISVATPTVVAGERCGPGTVTLSATSNPGTTLNWYSTAIGTTSIANGASFTTPSISTTTNYWVSSAAGSAAQPLTSPTIGSSEFFTANVGWGLRFTVNSVATIDQVTVKARNTTAGAASMQVKITDLNDVVLYSGVLYNFNITTTATEYDIPVGIQVPPGDYKMVMTSTGITQLVRESSGMTFPYTDPGNNVAITAGANGTGSAQTTSAYYWFYNWIISTGCESPRQMVTATIKTAPIVNLGNDTTICPNATITLNAGNPGNTYLWSNNTSAQTLNVSNAGTYSVKVTGSNACSQSDTIVITAGIVPLNSLPATTDLCVGDTATLDAGNAGSTYLWSNAASTQTIDINTAGSYNVIITSVDGCNLTSNTLVTSRPLPIVDLGADTAICAGDQTILDAGNAGMNYLWNTGVNTQTINVNAAGTYSVIVTSTFNCKGKDTVVVTTLPLPTVDAFSTVDLSAQEVGKMQFNAVNPQNVTSYDWNFGDGSNHSSDASPIHTFTSNGTFTVTLKVSNDCGEDSVSFTVTIEGVGIALIDKNGVNFTLYPNPTRTEVIITNKSTDAQMQQISIVNVLGSVVFEKATNGEKVQKVDVSKLASGLYTARILTDKGLVIRKFEVIR